LFAALLAALEGVVEEPVVVSAEAGESSGEEAAQNAQLLALLSGVDDVNLVDEVDIVGGPPVKSAEVAAAVPTARNAVAKVAVVAPESAPPALPTLAVQAAAQPAPPVTNSAAATPPPTVVDPASQIGRPVNVEALAAARPPVPAEVVPEAPVLTVAKGTAPTVPIVPVEQATQVAQLTEPRLLGPANHAPVQHSNDPLAIAKSEPETPVPIDFEKAKGSLSVLSAKEESPSTSLRKAVEAFAKPVTGHSEIVANAPRPQTQAFVPVTAGESTQAPVADVSRVAPTIAPAELGADAPKTVAAPEAPERPVRTTLPDLAKTALRSVRYMARNGEHRMTLRLIPESLGEVHIEVLSTKEALTVKLVSDSAVVRDAMESQAHLLRDSLSQEGLDVKNISISEESGSGRGASNQRDANAARNGERGQSQTGQPPAPDQSSGSNAKYATPRARHEGAFDQVA
jgi:flagellar hook-length control protein FliK